MKEATGELNMTVIAVVAIAAIGALFYAVIWPNIRRSINNTTHCADAICPANCTGKCDCIWVEEDGTTEHSIKCNIKEDNNK